MMPRKVLIREADLEWLYATHRMLSYTDLAAGIGCCTDTLKRILVREGLQEFDGAKYQVRRGHDVPQWNRPCIDCGSPERRPRNWFFCRSCRDRLGYEET